MSNPEKRNPSFEEAKKMIDTPRGHYILSQALFLAIDSMNRRPIEGTGDGQLEREPSNLAHMKLLYTQLLNKYKPMPAIPVVNASLDDIKDAYELSVRQLSDTLEGTYQKPHYLIDQMLKEAIDKNILSNDINDTNFWKNYIYLETDKNGHDYFRHKNGSIVTSSTIRQADYEDKSNKIINLDNARRKKHD